MSPNSKTFVLKDMGAKAMEATLATLHKAKVLVGYPGNGPQHEGGEMSVAALAIVHEFGILSQNIPSRPFMRQTWNRNKSQVKEQAKLAFTMVIRGKWAPRLALARIGVDYEGRIQDTITNGTFTPLSPVTIAKKGSSKPLIDTGDLRRRVTSKVEGV